MKKNILLIIFVLCIVAIPQVITSTYLIGVLTLIAIYALAALGLEMLMGFGGQISLGNGGFIAVGAYVTAILSGKGINPFIILIAVVLITIVVAVVVGLPILRLEGYYLAIATLGFALLIQALAVSMFSLTGGSSGLSIPPLEIFNFVFFAEKDYFYLSFVFLAIGYLYARNLAKTRMGRALIAIKSNEDAASALGINTGRVKLEIFVISAIFASLSGFLLANYLQFVSPDIFGFTLSVDLVVISLLGGHGIIYGPILGSTVWFALTESLHALEDYKIIFTGLCLIIILLFLPNGIYGLFRKIASKFKFRRLTRNRVSDQYVEKVVSGKGQHL